MSSEDPTSSDAVEERQNFDIETLKEYSCRYYENEYPEIEDLVVVKVMEYEEVCAYVQLLEYNNISGMILKSELSARRIRSASKILRKGKDEVVMVLRVDKEKGYIDLSKRRVQPEDIPKALQKYNMSKLVQTIMRYVAIKNETPILSLYEKVVWPLTHKYKHCYNAFRAYILNGDDSVFKGLDVNPEVLECLKDKIKTKMAKQDVKIRAEMDITCFSEQGIIGIKNALSEGLKLSTDQVPLSIKLISSPHYIIQSNVADKNQGIEVVNKAIEVIKQKLSEFGGHLSVKSEPKMVNEKDDQEFDDLINKLNEEDEKEMEEEESYDQDE